MAVVWAPPVNTVPPFHVCHLSMPFGISAAILAQGTTRFETTITHLERLGQEAEEWITDYPIFLFSAIPFHSSATGKRRRI